MRESVQRRACERLRALSTRRSSGVHHAAPALLRRARRRRRRAHLPRGTEQLRCGTLFCEVLVYLHKDLLKRRPDK